MSPEDCLVAAKKFRDSLYALRADVDLIERVEVCITRTKQQFGFDVFTDSDMD